MKILIVGLGSIATKHINSIRKLISNHEIYALRSGENAKNIEGVNNIYHLNDENIIYDFAIISNPTELHYEYILKLADKKINLFIEKPPVKSLLQVNDISNAIKLNKINTYVACNLRFHPCIQFLKNYFNTNKQRIINEVNVYFGSYLPDWRPNRDFRTVYSSIPELGGGVHLDLFHEFDYSYWLFGAPSNVNSIKRNVSSLKIPAIDSAVYILEYCNYNINIVLNYYRKDAKRSIEILFEDETWTIDLLKNSITNNENKIIYKVENYTLLDTYDSQMKYYLNCIKNNLQTYSFDDSAEILKICLSND